MGGDELSWEESLAVSEQRFSHLGSLFLKGSEPRSWSPGFSTPPEHVFPYPCPSCTTSLCSWFCLSLDPYSSNLRRFHFSRKKQTPMRDSLHMGPERVASWKPLTMLLPKSWYPLAFFETLMAGPIHTEFWKNSFLLTNMLSPHFLRPNNHIWSTVFLHFLPVRYCSSFPLNSQIFFWDFWWIIWVCLPSFK